MFSGRAFGATVLGLEKRKSHLLGMLLLIFLLVVIRVVNSFHKDLAVIDLVSHSPTEQFADSRTFEIVSGTHGLSYSLKNAPMGLPFRDKRR